MRKFEIYRRQLLNEIDESVDDKKTLKGLLRKNVYDIEVLTDVFEAMRLVYKVDEQQARRVNDFIKHLTIVQSTNEALSLAERDKFYNLEEKSLFFASRYDFDSYLMYLEWDRPADKKFYMPRRKQLSTIVKDLQDLEDGKINFLAISLPPRVGKSTTGIMFMAWQMGKYPDKANLMSGHSNPLTEGFYKELLSIISDPQYRWGSVFYDRRIIGTSAQYSQIDIAAAGDDRKVMRRFPTVTCRSIEGTLTGAVEVANILYCDDLIRDLEEAISAERKEKKYNDYLNTLKDRKLDGAKELHIGTRWAPDDVIGRIEKQYENDPTYRFRVMPALNENDESNFDYAFGKGFSTAYYIDMRNSLDTADWWAKYMGKPYVREGLLFPPDELRYYNGVLPDGEPDMILSHCDVAWGGGDSLAMPIGYVYGEDIYIHDVVFNRGDKTVTRPIVVGKLAKHKPHKGHFEANNGGDEYCDRVDLELRKRGIRLNLTYSKAPSNMSKMARIVQVAPEIKKMYFRSEKCRDKEYKGFMRELTTFVQGGKNKHDDAPDSLAGLVNLLHGGVRVAIEKRTF